jgi:hypothetical protein
MNPKPSEKSPQFHPAVIIQRKRDGEVLTDAEIRFLIAGLLSGTVADYQLSAFLMAVFFKGMTPEETVSLTRAMLESGERYDFSDIPGVKVDKHSTGGIGDKVSMILAPLAAACGLVVPMMAGRGLSHTGGTLDKLEAIPGFNVNLSSDRFRTALKTIGCAIIGQSEKIAPADRKLYALRDVTATVESLNLWLDSFEKTRRRNRHADSRRKSRLGRVYEVKGPSKETRPRTDRRSKKIGAEVSRGFNEYGPAPRKRSRKCDRDGRVHRDVKDRLGSE